MSKSGKNLNLIFNKMYYACLGEKEGCDRHFREMNTLLTSARFNPATDYRKLPFEYQRILLKTTYPGMLIGSGNPHSMSNANDAINMGFSFDYVTGQPFIPGSSVKGILRSCFRKYPEDVAALAGLQDTTQVQLLEKALFEEKNVFLDAVVCEGGAQDRMLGLDNITPHSGITRNPIPVLMIKILPEVKFEFRFLLTPCEWLSVEQQLNLFTQLLVVFGAGGKTNTGYGVLELADQAPAAKTETRSCRNCHKPFTLEEWQQKFILEKGNDPFKTCPTCYQAWKNGKR